MRVYYIYLSEAPFFKSSANTRTYGGREPALTGTMSTLACAEAAAPPPPTNEDEDENEDDGDDTSTINSLPPPPPLPVLLPSSLDAPPRG